MLDPGLWAAEKVCYWKFGGWQAGEGRARPRALSALPWNLEMLSRLILFPPLTFPTHLIQSKKKQSPALHSRDFYLIWLF